MRRNSRKMWGLICCLSAWLTTARADDWPQWRGPHRDGVWRETGIIEKFDSPEIKIRWRVPISNGYSGPTVADGRVYVMDRIVEPTEQERVHCFDWQTGKRLWTFAYECVYEGIGYPDGPRASVTIDAGRAYALGAMGNLHCLDAVTGKVLWGKDLNAAYKIRMPIWGIAASPLIEGDLVIVHIGGSDNACLVAFDKRTGQERWRALNDRANYSSPIVITQAGKRVLICWTGDRVVGLDAASGQLYWEYPFPPVNMPLGVATPVVEKDRLFLCGFYDGSLMLRLLSDRPAVEKIWQRRGQNERSTDALHSIISTPLLMGDYIYGVDSYGELRCLDARNGDRLWENLDAVPRARWATIHFVRHGDRVWMFNERGQLIIGRLTPQGFDEISRAQLIKPTTGQLPQRGGVCWSHPAFAYKHVFARNDEELVCASLEASK
ncbi:MAG: PQQ-like beta-propeller repeat protein [Abditibacteriales bacterium]|nr:PQQ-like beta-propeller repeat protein [Abditibacteriales bacterium]